MGQKWLLPARKSCCKLEIRTSLGMMPVRLLVFKNLAKHGRDKEDRKKTLDRVNRKNQRGRKLPTNIPTRTSGQAPWGWFQSIGCSRVTWINHNNKQTTQPNTTQKTRKYNIHKLTRISSQSTGLVPWESFQRAHSRRYNYFFVVFCPGIVPNRSMKSK